MKLSRPERWILANQYRILAALDPKQREDYERYADALEQGYSAYIDEMAERVYSEQDAVSEEDCSFVINTMAMYDALQRSYKDNSPAGVQEAEVQFPGFDGNNETSLMGYARFVVDREGKFTYLKRTQDLNSHMPSVGTYRRMLDVWNGLGQSYGMSEEEMRQVLDARTHPSNRST